MKACNRSVPQHLRLIHSQLAGSLQPTVDRNTGERTEHIHTNPCNPKVSRLAITQSEYKEQQCVFRQTKVCKC